MQKPREKKYRLLIFIIAISVLPILILLWHQLGKHPKNKNVKLINGSILNPARKLQSFSLIDQTGKPFQLKNLYGHWSLFFFGYTRCPDICPTTLIKLNRAYQLLKKQMLAPLPQVIFVSVNPEYDTPLNLRNYLHHFNADFIGATGNKQQLTKLSKQLGTYFHRNPHQTQQQGALIHTDTIMVINPHGAWVAVLSSPHNSQAIAKDYISIVRTVTIKNNQRDPIGYKE